MRTCSQVAYCLEWQPVGEDGIVADDLASSTLTIDEHATVLPQADMRVNGTANSRLRTLRSVLVSVVLDAFVERSVAIAPREAWDAFCETVVLSVPREVFFAFEATASFITAK